MNVKSCKGCSRLFNYIAGPHLCPNCREKLEEKFQEVKAYINDHKGVSIQTVSEECDVDNNQIKQWLREGRLEITEDSAIFINCESCGAPIKSGRFCNACAYKMQSGFNSIVEDYRKQNEHEIKKTGNAKMRFMQ